MARRPNEQAVIDRFAAYMHQETGLVWRPSPDEVSTGKNSRRPDCEFTCSGQTPIVADVCSLFPTGSDQAGQARRRKFIERLLPELQREGVGGVMIELPPLQRKHAQLDYPRKAALLIREAVQRLPMDACTEVEGFKLRRVAESSEPPFFYHSSFNGHWPSDSAGQALAVLLRNKHDQIDVDHHQRYLVAINAGSYVTAEDLVEACALIDFREYPNFDRIYFEEAPGKFQVVYDRHAWLAMNAGRLPDRDESLGLVACWLETRLRAGQRGALDAVLEISCELHSTDWLSENGRSVLELEAQLLLQNCEWDTPRQMWEMFRGPIPKTLDARRKAQPITTRVIDR